MSQLICPQCQARYKLNREIPTNATFQCRKCQHKFKAVVQTQVPLALASDLPDAVSIPPRTPHIALLLAAIPLENAPLAEPPVVRVMPEKSQIIADPTGFAAPLSETDNFGFHFHETPVATVSTAVPTARLVDNVATPLIIAERRAQQKRKNTILLFACCGFLLLLAAGGGVYLLLRDPKIPLAKKNSASAKDTSNDAKQLSVAEPTTSRKQPVESKTTPAAEPMPEPMPALKTAEVAPSVTALTKEIKARMVTMRMEQPVLHAHLATDGTMAVVANANGEVDGYALIQPAHLWSYEDPIGAGMPWKISSVAFSTASSTTTQQALVFVSGNLMADDLFLVSLDAKDGKEVGQYHSIKGPASFMQFHPLKPNMLLVGLNNATGSLQLLNLNEDKPVAELLDAHESAISGMAISADGTRCITTSKKMVEGKEQACSVLTIWSLADVGREREYSDFAGNATAIALSPDGKLLAVHESGKDSGTIHVLSFPELELVTKIAGVAATVPAGQQLHVFLPTDDALAVAMGLNVAIFNGRTGEKRSIVPKLFNEKPYALLISSDGKTFLTSSGTKDFKTAKLP